MNYECGGIALIGCIVTGAGLKILFDQHAGGSVLGVGVGFLVMALIGRKSNKQS